MHGPRQELVRPLNGRLVARDPDALDVARAARGQQHDTVMWLQCDAGHVVSFAEPANTTKIWCGSPSARLSFCWHSLIVSIEMPANGKREVQQHDSLADG